MIIKQYINQDLDTGKELHKEYINAKPYPWIELPRFLNQDVADYSHFTFPNINENWYSYSNELERKFAIDDIDRMPDTHAQIMMVLNSRPMVKFLEDLTGIPGLITDHTWRGAGLHQSEKGGKLAIHSDRQIHPTLNIYRRVNLIIFLNKFYKSDYGGDLEFWSKDMKKCVQSIEPSYNKCVIFSTSADSYHGCPDPWMGASTRKSIVSYYWTSSYPADLPLNTESTKFQLRPVDNKAKGIKELIEKRNKGRLKSNV
jgi:Rps23 Pro-64 3,4-dihydroxylase Tpa1-like proline 4-hydroxylase